jgi:DNA-directed RNA polymerase subunit M/transcription elongation factor TFIIS
MSSKLANLQLGPLKESTSTRATAQLPPTIAQTRQVAEIQVVSLPPEVQFIKRIPNSEPFLTIDLVFDVVFLLQYEGSRVFLDSLPKDEDGNILGQNVVPIKPEALLLILINQTWEAFLASLYPYTQLQPQELIIQIYNDGVAPLSVLFSQADPLNPSSLIFNHPSQDVHRALELIDIEMIKNEPEISDSATVQCACGSRKVKTATVQTRGGDEASTIFATCVSCKMHWKFSAA